MIRELREEIQRLKDMVQSGGTGRPTMMALDDDAANDNKTKMEEMIANLERAKQQVSLVHSFLYLRMRCSPGKKRNDLRNCTKRNVRRVWRMKQMYFTLCKLSKKKK